MVKDKARASEVLREGAEDADRVSAAAVHAKRTDATGGVRMPLRDLADALVDRGLTVMLEDREELLTVRNGASTADDPTSPGVSQVVSLRMTRNESLSWFWWWPGPHRDAPPEFEPLCPAADIEQAATRIVAVLRLDERAQG